MVTVNATRQADGAWALACGCAWTDTVSIGFRTTPAQAQARAAEKAQAHLRAKHGTKSCLVRQLQGRVREFSGVNEKLLDKDQREHYTLRVRAANLRGPATSSKPQFRMKLRDSQKTMLLLVAWMVVWIALFAMMVDATNQVPNGDNAGVIILLLLTSLALGTITTFMLLFREAEEWRLKLVSDYLDSIGFEHRDPSAPRVSYDNSDYMSKRQRDHLWYGDHADLNWRDREQAQAWGMDADTYKSNWLEHDKD